MSERDYAAEIDALAKRIAAIERLVAIAPVEQGPIDDDDLAREFHEAYERLAPRFGYETRKQSAKPWSEVPDNNRCLMRAVMSAVMQPKLAAKDAEIVRLKADNVRLRDDYQVAVNNIGYRSQELKEANAEVERLKADIENAVWNLAGCDSIALARKPLDFCRDMARPALESVNDMARELVEVKQQLATRTQELDAARNERTSLRIELGDVKTKYLEQAKDLTTARRDLESFVNDPGHNRLRREVESLTAKLAEAEKETQSAIGVYQDTCKLLQEANAEIERLKQPQAFIDHVWELSGNSEVDRLKRLVSKLQSDRANYDEVAKAGVARIAELKQQLSAATAANVERDQLYSDCHQELAALVESVRAFQRLTGMGFDIEVGKQNRWIKNHPLAAKKAGGE